ncbi:MAG TPA: hypothetical protein VGE55_11745 [Limnobacter sp.]|uniref:hypothetical protein n=1 Tax=Limnobacter sp. TaxID=2003368 RepID=UPI002ED906FD
MKKTAIAASLLTALLSIHTGASATCTGTTCSSDISAEVDFGASYYLSPNHNGIIIQKNTGSNVSNVDLRNVVITNNGTLTADSTSVGNNVNVEVNIGATVPVRHVSQSNYGDQVALVTANQLGGSKPGEVTLSASAIGNNFGYTATGTSLAELSVAQCNVGDNLASVMFNYDPSKLSASAISVGNNISVRGVKP